MTLPCSSSRERRGPPQVASLKGPAALPADRALFLDDDRDPAEDGRSWVVVRTVGDAVAWMKAHGIPTYMSFDHDLGQPDSGADLAQWIIEHDLDQPGALPEEFSYFVHSQNVEGAKAIVGKLNGYLQHRALARQLPSPRFPRRSTMGV